MEKLSIIIPAHNEEKRIGKTLEQYLNYFGNLKKNEGLGFEIVVVLNACKDKTRGVVEKYKRKELIILEFERGGKGFAIIEGFKNALKRNNDFIGFVDADASTPPEAFYELVKTINGFDGVIANRWDKKSVVTKQVLFRRFLSRGYNLIIRSLFLLPYIDTQCGAKLFKKKVLGKNINKLVTSNWGFDIALLFCLRKESKAKIISIPTIWEDKQESKINIKLTPARMFASAIRLRLIHSPFKDFVRLYRKLPERFKFH